MDIGNIITICVLCAVFGNDFVLSVPTFGTEFVHIKVYMPHQIPCTTKIHFAPMEHEKHKIIHHYHRLQQPTIKLPIEEKAPLLENLYLTELDKHHGVEDAYQRYLVNEYLVAKPIEVSSVQEYDHYFKNQPQQENNKNYEKTVNLIENYKNDKNDYNDYNDNQHGQTPRYDYEDMGENYEYSDPKDQVNKIIQSPKYTPSIQTDDYYGQMEEVAEEGQKYHDYYKSQTKDELLPVYTKQDLENTQSQYQTNYDYQKPIDQYSKDLKISVEEHMEYENPTNDNNLKKKILKHLKPSSPNHEHIQYYSSQPDPESYSPTYTKPTEDRTQEYMKYVKYSENHPDLNEPHTDNQKKNTREDYLKNKDTFSSVENQYSAETYTGYDSYSAGHVQGLRSRRYQNHMT